MNLLDKPESSLLTAAGTAEKRLPDVQRDGLESAPDATLLVRGDGTIADLNHYAEVLFGYEREELVGQNLNVLIPERFRGVHAHHSAGYMHEPRPRAMGSGMDLWGLRKDGGEFPVDIALSPRQTAEGTYVVCSIRDLSARLGHAIKEQLRFERLVTDISAHFASLRDEDVDAEITHGLQQIAEFLQVDRGGLCEFSSEQGTLTTTYFYVVPGIAPPPPQILHSQFPWYTSKVRRGEIQRYQRLPDDLPPEAAAEREYTIATGMRAHLSVPIKVGGWVAYLLNVDSHRSSRPWPDALVGRLQLLGEIFASALMRKRAHQALQESEAKFRLLAETATCGIAIYQDDRFQYVSPQATEITGYSADEMLSMSVEQLIHPDSRAAVLERAQRRLRGEPVPARYEIKILTQQGEERWVDFTAAVTQYKGRPAIIGTAFDVTQRKRAQEALHELSGRLIQAQEEERTRIARELHDDLSQRLALVTIGLEELGLQADGSALTRQLQALSEQTKEIAAEVHHLSRQLHPSQLEMLGLVAAVRSFCSELSKQRRIEIDFKQEEVPRALPAEVTLCLYRIVQESLQNVCKHSGARRARVELSGRPEAVHLAIADDGAGFDPDLLGTSAGLGLVSMRERVRLVHGEFSIHSKPGQGTRLEARIPLAP